MKLEFAAALARAEAPLIAEIKPASPKDGDLLRQMQVGEIARDYARAGVACLSVTTGRWHNGSVGMIREIAETGLPVLRKDFIVSARHLRDSLQAGASAVLLTCSLLRNKDVVRLAAMALDLGLTPFVEAANETELDGLDLPGGSVLAINNRNIRVRETDDGGVEHSLALYRSARARHAGLLVSASGFRTPADARKACMCGFDGILVGTAFMNGDNGPGNTAGLFMDAMAQARAPAS
ncbi:hypothetical protein [Roseibium sp. Sym1]|uniref:hypothetical protein n=1 Tax=Roseibium sp. Sym1 TaxID=3016006 RepID=UPI0022B312C7|nr:hypothetical protein [Roseibium sp. Sym1]